MSEHRVVITRTPDAMLTRWQVAVDNSTINYTHTHWGALRVARRALRTMDMEPEVYLVRAEEGTP